MTRPSRLKGYNMSEQYKDHTQTTEVDAPSTGLNTGRRKLVRAGLAAAPVVAAFKGNMVLAATSGTNVTVRASSFASLDTTQGSVSPNARTTGAFLTLSECERYPGCDELLFGPDGCDGKTKRGCGFDMVPSPKIAAKTLKQVFNMKARSDLDLERLAQYVAAGYLSAKRFGSDSYISEQRCKEIWSNHGSWEPTAGVRWDLAKTCDYFARVYSGTGFSDCLMHPGSCG